MRVLLLACLFLLNPPLSSAETVSSAETASSAETDPVPVPVPIPRLEAAVSIDGILDEPVWNDAVLLSGFQQYLPVDGRAAVDSTQVLVWYGPTSINFGIRAFETHGTVRATLADRDKLASDDQVMLVLDTYNDQRQAIVIATNPLGQQADGILRDSDRSGMFRQQGGSYTVDLSPDYVYASMGRLTDYGYEVEIQIPFKSLRYQGADVQDWGFNIVRSVQHSGYSLTWTDVRQSGASFLAQSGLLAGLRDLRRGVVLDVSPEFTGGASRPAGDVPFERAMRDPLGVNVRWGVTNNLTLNGTVNPDFSQVEADVAQIQFDPRQALFFPEKRPFFLDGVELFQSPTNLVYTRRIANPLSAVKLTGKVGSTNVAVLSAVDNKEAFLSDLDPRYFQAVRVRRDLSGQSTVGLTLTDRSDSDAWNRVVAVDGRLVSGIYGLTYQAGGSFSGGSGDVVSAPMWRLSASARSREYGASFTAFGFHEDFQAGTGFINRTGIAHMTFVPTRTWFGGEGSFVESFTGGITLDGEWDYDRFTAGKGPNDRKLHFNSSARVRGGWSASLSVFYESFKYPGNLYTNYYLERKEAGVVVDTVAYSGTNRLTNLGFWTTLSTPRWRTFSANLFVVAGRDDNFFEWAPADIYFYTVTLNWNPTEQLRVSLLYNHQQYLRADDKSTVGLRRVPRLKVEYQATSALFFRLVGQYDANYVDALRDNSRTEEPILVLDQNSGTYSPIEARRSNFFRVDGLVSYRPTPGTVVFLGYGSSLTEPDTYRFADLTRLQDGVFAKLSYRWRP